MSPFPFLSLDFFNQLPLLLSTSSIPGPITLEAAGLLVLADLPAVALRTALTGGASFLDALVLVPGMHKQQCADEINRGEFPTTGVMTSGYVFRVENPATNRVLQSLFVSGSQATVLYFLCLISTVVVFALLGVIGDWWGFGALGMFVFARLINVIVIRRRSQQGWKGAIEDGDGDLLILLSQDRWVRLQGSINDLKAVTAGQWLRDLSATENFTVMFATTVVYAAAILAFNASTVGSVLIGGLPLWSVALLTLSNSLTRCFQMYNCIVQMDGNPVRYGRRLEMANKLVDESKREDWAVGMGLVLPKIGSNRPVTV
ncbi:hypothetical protein F5146DRAFT_1122490 [Armillaria mellea]|nr:hypothetical protein F5146DRAFT_1122490 [Armillaria mellea]